MRPISLHSLADPRGWPNTFSNWCPQSHFICQGRSPHRRHRHTSLNQSHPLTPLVSCLLTHGGHDVSLMSFGLDLDMCLFCNDVSAMHTAYFGKYVRPKVIFLTSRSHHTASYLDEHDAIARTLPSSLRRVMNSIVTQHLSRDNQESNLQFTPIDSTHESELTRAPKQRTCHSPSPPRKRARYPDSLGGFSSHSDMQGSTAAHRDETYYFSDGSCILLVQDTLFKVCRNHILSSTPDIFCRSTGRSCLWTTPRSVPCLRYLKAKMKRATVMITRSS
jgi:hypothetical protein